MASLATKQLWSHITKDDLSAVHALLEGGNVNLEERDENGCTFLMLACERGDVNIVRELLKAGLDPNTIDYEKWNALLCASKEGHLETVMELLELNVDLEHTDMCGWTALMWACYRGNPLVVSELLERGANPNVKADHHMTCLSWAAGRGHTDIALKLISKGAKINMQDKYGTTPLIWACRKGALGIVDTLLSEGAVVDVSGMNSWTPLLVATKGGYFDVVSSLLNQDPNNINSTDKDGMTALAVAAKEGYSDIASDLLQKGAYVNIQDRNQDSILIHSVKGGHIEIVAALLKKYVDVDVPGQDGKTAIYCAVEKGYSEIAKLLLKSNPDLELFTKDEDTPLLRAVRMRHEECVRLLINKGAKVSHCDKRGDTALHIAIRARAKRITELLLCNPRHSRLLYRLNKAGETPYSMDAYYQRGILPQIYGHGKLNASDAENLLGYEIYSSALADILSEPGLITPITMGLYAKWGSGKSFLLDKLREEMRSFTQQNSREELMWSWMTAFMLFWLSVVLGEVLGLAVGWWLGLAVGGGSLIATYVFIGVVLVLTRQRDINIVSRVSAAMARRQKRLHLFMQMLFCVPHIRTQVDKQTLAHTFYVRFLFSECTRLTSVGGEKSLAAMIGTLCEAVEKEYGFFMTRLFRVFKTAPAESKGSRFKSVCCIPYFLIVLMLISTVQVGLGLLYIYNFEDTEVNFVLIVMASVVSLALLINLKMWGQMMMALALPQKRRVNRAAEQISDLKIDGFMQKLKTEVDLMSRMVSSLDSFTNDQTRLVVVVDGLDSCEQNKVLQVLDTVKSLFSEEGSPFITILAVDPHVIIKGIEQNLRTSFQDTNVNGFDYLRNVVHLPFYLQSQGIRISAAQPAAGESPSRSNSRQDSVITMESSRDRARSRQMSTSQVKDLSGSITGGIYASSLDLTTNMAKNDYFSDINPRSMRRLMNIVAVTARLLRAYNVDFKWQRLAAWVNLTEQWPYRLSWIIYYLDELTEHVDNGASLHSLYKCVSPSIPATKEQDPLTEIDRNVRKLEATLTSKSSNFPILSVADLRKFLPCTINLDPYLRKLIRENQHNAERQQAELMGGPVGVGWARNPSFPGSRQKELNTAAQPAGIYSSPGRISAPLASQAALYNQTPSAYTALSVAAQQQGMSLVPLNSPPQVSSFQAVKHPSHFFTPYTPFLVSTLSVSEVCDLLSNLTGLSRLHLREYQTHVRDNNISGLVLAMCDLSELQPVMHMKFGDWQLFRSAITSLIHFENSSNSEEMTSSTTPAPNIPKAFKSQVKVGGSPIDVRKSPKNLRKQSESDQRHSSSLENIQEGRMKRQDSIVQQLSYENAFLTSAMSEFIEDSDEEGFETEDNNNGVQFRLGADDTAGRSDDGAGGGVSPIHKVSSASKSLGRIVEIASTEEEYVPIHSKNVFAASFKTATSDLSSRNDDTLKDTSSFVTVLDTPHLSVQGSTEFVPLLDSQRKSSKSSWSSSELLTSHSSLSQVSEIENTSNSNSSATRAAAVKSFYSGNSKLVDVHFSSGQPPAKLKKTQTQPPTVDSQHPKHKSHNPLHHLGSSLDRLVGPVLDKLHIAHGSQDESSSTTSHTVEDTPPHRRGSHLSEESQPHRRGSHLSEENQPHRRGSHLLEKTFSTIVEMVTPDEHEENFHSRLGESFDHVAHLPEDEKKKRDSPDRETKF